MAAWDSRSFVGVSGDQKGRLGERAACEFRVRRVGVGAASPGKHVRLTCSTCHTVEVKRNLTIQLDDDLIHRAKVIAAERGTSVSGLVAQQITELIAARDRYVRARESALRMMSEATDRGGRHWTREELHEERLSRYGT